MQLGPAGVHAELGTAARPMQLVTVSGHEAYKNEETHVLKGIPQEILVRLPIAWLCDCGRTLLVLGLHWQRVAAAEAHG